MVDGDIPPSLMVLFFMEKMPDDDDDYGDYDDYDDDGSDRRNFLNIEQIIIWITYGDNSKFICLTKWQSRKETVLNRKKHKSKAAKRMKILTRWELQKKNMCVMIARSNKWFPEDAAKLRIPKPGHHQISKWIFFYEY